MKDTPTHRTHILQAQLKQIVEWTQLLQTRRAAIVEKVVRATANSKIARALLVERSLDRSIAIMFRDLNSTNDKLNKIADRLNKCRGLLLEISDGEILLEKTEYADGKVGTTPDTRDERHDDVHSLVQHESEVHKPE